MAATADEPTPAKIVCRRCYKILDAGDNFCRHCGTPANGQGDLPDVIGVGRLPGAGVRPPGWSESPWTVLPMLFLVLGPLALPMLWRSRHFSLPWKNVLTLLVIALTIFVIWRIWALFGLILAPLQELQKINGL